MALACQSLLCHGAQDSQAVAPLWAADGSANSEDCYVYERTGKRQKGITGCREGGDTRRRNRLLAQGAVPTQMGIHFQCFHGGA
ncbi:hypothetical protein AK812_SmicGene8000 [Symbiodinium microadriaticum]|uniref:Uncharacterized protein n=1 Tax=Symbiodinium microadriaticum TaxID=2951 RepID=A0A1Q9EM64_SYMMI|nr:hypothetical protein AK812_SmicGene8000 [Symbiodinium microadriaticum]